MQGMRKKDSENQLMDYLKSFQTQKIFAIMILTSLFCYEKKVLILMNSWERFDETTLPYKEALYSELNLEDISDEDYIHAQKRI